MKQKPIKKTNKKVSQIRDDGYNEIRVYHKKGHNKKSPRYRFKCGCCDKSVEIFYDKDDLEINGVIGSIENWRELLLPLLNMKPSEK